LSGEGFLKKYVIFAVSEYMMMRLFLSAVCFLVLNFSCNVDKPARRITEPDIRSFDWTMKEAGVEVKLLFGKKLAFDSLTTFYGMALTDSRTGKSYEGDYYADTVSLQRPDQIKVFLPKKYFMYATDTPYEDLLRDKKYLYVRVFRITASPLRGKLLLGCDKKGSTMRENYFDYRIFPESERLDELCKTSKIAYSIREMEDTTCRLIYYSDK
jgi:hypothetical protein